MADYNELTDDQIETLQSKFASSWQFEKNYLVKRTELKDYNQVVRFFLAAEKPQRKLDHHAHFYFVYDTVEIILFTHDTDSVTLKDFELALHIDAILDKMRARDLS
jgi:4a-hydroxytetrahydrobiopterin dehydratase